MSDFEELDSSIHDALRHVPPASASLRDAHIAAALGEIAPAARRTPGRLRILGSVAAATVLAVGGLSVIRQNSDNNQVSVNSTLPPKTGATCASELSQLRDDARDSSDFSHQNEPYVVMIREDSVEVYEGTAPCSQVGTLEYSQAQIDRDSELPGSVDAVNCKFASESIISQFTATANGNEYSFVLLKTDRGLALYFEDRCNSPIATLDLP